MTRQNRPRAFARTAPLVLLMMLMPLGVFAGGALADDVIITTTGRRYVGTIILQTASKVHIKTVLHNISTTVKLRRSEIARIEKTKDEAPKADTGEDAETNTEKEVKKEAEKAVEKEAPSATDAGGPSAAPAEDEAPVILSDEGPSTFTRTRSSSLTRGLNVTPAPAKRDGIPMYLEIPLQGTFGEDIYPKGVGEALLWASDNGVTDIVFRIESPGGAVWVAERIVELMNEQRGDLTYHALIERSISASIWPSFACETISMAPRSDFGGAVAFRMDAATGSAEVDMKMNSIRMADVVTEAEENGHSGPVVRAMMISDQELYAVLPAGESEWELRGSEPIDKSRYDDYEALDSGESILTLTANQAERFGIAPKLKSERADALRERLGIEVWDDAGPAGYELTEHYAKACDDMMGKIQAQSATINSSIARYLASKYVRPSIRALEQYKKDVAVFARLRRQAQELDLGVVISEMDSNWRQYNSQEVERILKVLRRQLRGP